MIKKQDALQFMKEQKDYGTDIVYCDPPYALGSEIIIREDGKVDYKNTRDFMNKWEMPTGDYWEEWFKEAYRTIKYGGYVIMFGMDRQLLLFKYYAKLVGFAERQSLYWFFISNFPKASDLSKNLDKNAGAEREKVKVKGNKNNEVLHITKGEMDNNHSITPLAKKYDGYKYSISPLKQTNETVMIFSKPYKTGSCMRDVLAYENGDTECCCGALNIDGNRVGIEGEDTRQAGNRTKTFGGDNAISGGEGSPDYIPNEQGRYPAQTFIQCICKNKVIIENKNNPYNYSNKEYNNKDTSMFNGDKPQAMSNYNDKNSGQIHTNPNCPCYILDKQSGVKKSIKSARGGARNDGTTVYQNIPQNIDMNYECGYSDTGGCSKILVKCDFEKDEHDLYMYCPKVSKAERNLGCEEMEDSDRFQQGNYSQSPVCSVCGKTFNGTNDHSKCGKNTMIYKTKDSNKITKNTNPCLKPISLNHKILSLFKTSNPQKILFPFAGSGSEIIGGIKAGFTDWEACEINEEYIEIAEARIKYWSNKFEDENRQQILL